MKKRYFLWAGSGAIASACLSRYFGQASENKTAIANINTNINTNIQIKIQRTESEWRERLTPEQFKILRLEGTERAGTSPLLKEYRKGIFACAGCDRPLFQSTTKYESGTGWPSFYRPIDQAVETRQDGLRREVHCQRCGGHLGHVFNDGPPPTDQRYCINGLALKFIAQS